MARPWSGSIPSKSPKGNQLDVVESMDLENGLIAYHRVYWGWIGFKALQAVADRSSNACTFRLPTLADRK